MQNTTKERHEDHPPAEIDTNNLSNYECPINQLLSAEKWMKHELIIF